MHINLFPTHQDQSIEEKRLLKKLCAANSRIYFGLDIMFYPPGLYSSGRSRRYQLRYLAEYSYSYLKWWISNLIKGDLIFPTSMICMIFDVLMPFYRQHLIDTSFHEYYLKHRNATTCKLQQQFYDEVMSTYIRYIAEPDELYGLKPFCKSTINHFVLRLRVYSICSKILFKLMRPKVFFTTQRSYLHKFIPCYTALLEKVPVVVIKCSDGSLYKASDSFVPGHWDPVFDPSYLESNYQAKYHYKPTSDDIKLIQRDLEKRVHDNSIDPSIGYMRVSPYGKMVYKPYEIGFKQTSVSIFDDINQLNQSFENGFLCIYMHEFNDYHHNGSLPAFASSYLDWLYQILEIVLRNKIPYIVKIHPAVLHEPSVDKYAASIKALNYLADHLSAKLNISTSLNTTELICAGLKLGCTLKGTIATELVYLGIPVVCCGNPPYKHSLPSRIVQNKSHLENILIHFNSCVPIALEEKISILEYIALSKRLRGQSLVSNASGLLVKNYNINLSFLSKA